MDTKRIKSHTIYLESKTVESLIKAGYSKEAAENIKRGHKSVAKSLRMLYLKIKR